MHIEVSVTLQILTLVRKYIFVKVENLSFRMNFNFNYLIILF